MSTLIKPLVLVVDDVQKNIDLMRAVLAPAGYRAADDWLATQAKVRFPAARVVARV